MNHGTNSFDRESLILTGLTADYAIAVDLLAGKAESND